MTGTSYFVLLEDYSVWWWRQDVHLGTVVAWLVGGPALGTSLGAWLSVILKRQLRRWYAALKRIG